MTSKIPLIIDCDPGVDDAVALFLAFASPEFEIMAVTTVAGNVGPGRTAHNARIIRELAGRQDVPVFAGSTRPMVRPPVEAANIHGESGLGPLELFEPASPLAPGHAVLAIVDMVMSRPPRSVTMAVTGPMTNLALAILLEPAMVEHLGPVIIMGGARSEGGNITPTAEFNVFADPHAAQVVFSSALEMVVFGLDATHQVRATAARTSALRRADTVAAKTTALLLDFANEIEFAMTGLEGTPLHDPCTIVWLLQPDLFETRPCAITVETSSPVTLGATSVNFRLKDPAASTCHWVMRSDADAVFQLLTERLRAGGRKSAARRKTSAPASRSAASRQPARHVS